MVLELDQIKSSLWETEENGTESVSEQTEVGGSQYAYVVYSVDCI